MLSVDEQSDKIKKYMSLCFLGKTKGGEVCPLLRGNQENDGANLHRPDLPGCVPQHCCIPDTGTVYTYLTRNTRLRFHLYEISGSHNVTRKTLKWRMRPWSIILDETLY